MSEPRIDKTKRKSVDKEGRKRLPVGGWIKVPVADAIQDLTFSEYAVWSGLKAMSWKDGYCYPEVKTIGEYFGFEYTWTWTILKSLRAKGWLRTERRGKGFNYYPVTPRGSLHNTEEMKSGSIQDSEEIQPDLFRKVNSTSSPYCRDTIHNTEDRSTKKEVLRKKYVHASRVETSEKRTKPKKAPIVSDRDEIQAILDAIDLAPFRDRFPTINVDALFEQYCDAMLNGTAKKPWPNPYDYRDFSKAFKNWCEREAKQSGGRVSANQIPTDPTHNLPRARDLKL